MLLDRISLLVPSEAGLMHCNSKLLHSKKTLIRTADPA
jgi:hypothetical protein